MLSTVKLRVQQEVNIYQFEVGLPVNDIYCQLREIMDFKKDSVIYQIINLYIGQV